MWISYVTQFKNKELLAGNISWDGGVPAKTCVLSCLSRVSHTMTIALSWVLLSFALLPFSMNPTATNSREEREGEREGWLSFRNIYYSLETCPCSQIYSVGSECLFVSYRNTAFCLASVPMRADILSYVHILCILFLSLSLSSSETWQAATSH